MDLDIITYLTHCFQLISRFFAWIYNSITMAEKNERVKIKVHLPEDEQTNDAANNNKSSNGFQFDPPVVYNNIVEESNFNNGTNGNGSSLIVDPLDDSHRSMSGPLLSQAGHGHRRTGSRTYPKDFTVATPEEFVKRFGGDRVINKVSLRG